MDRLEAMRLFVRVSELGSFTAAARQLGVARSVVTRQVAALEKHLGIRLLARTTRRVAVTAAGAAFARRSRDILALVETAESDAASERATPSGRIRLGLPLSFGVQHIAPLALEFAAANPQVELEMEFSDRRLNLVEEGFDLGIRLTARPSPTDVVRRLGRTRMLTVAAPAYLAAHGRPTHPGQLAAHDCLAYTGEITRHTWVYTDGGRPRGFPVRARLCAGNGDVLAEAAARGLGIALLPEFIVAPLVTSGRLETLLARHAPPTLAILAMLPGTGTPPLRVRLLLEHLAAGLARPARTRDAGQSSRRFRAAR